jgi:hypothetical protein
MLETDYLIIGCGAVGMAFADVILAETDATIIIVDKNEKPGGHWNFAYSFVRLHQPSEYYGVSSLELSKGRIDQVGLNQGLCNLASGAEVHAYFDDAMQHQFLPSGRVKYFPLCEYKGDGKFVSAITGKSYEVKVNKKTVDATYMTTSIPSTHTPDFTIAPGVQFMPVNGLPRISKKPEGYVVIGGGKTGIDACLWLLEHDVNPEDIRWIVPRDPWLLDRRTVQPGEKFMKYFLKDRAAHFESLAQAQSIPDLFDKLEAAGSLLRIDKNVQPRMYHCAVVSLPELEQLRRIQNIVRMGRVKKIENDQIILEEGTIETTPGHIHIDCSAIGLSRSKSKPVFSGNLITPQTVRTCQPVFSAAFIAHIEAAYDDEKLKNELCTVIPIPYYDTDWIRAIAVLMKNNYAWSQDSNLVKWLFNNRLEGGFIKAMAGSAEMDQESKALIERIRSNIKPAMAKLQMFMAELK